MGFTDIMIDIVFSNMARCLHINRAPIYDRCYDKRIYCLYLCQAKFGNGVEYFWHGNGVEIRIFVYPVKFS